MPQLVQEQAVDRARLCEVAVRLPSVEPATEGVDNTSEAVAVTAEERESNQVIFDRSLDIWTLTGTFLTRLKKRNLFFVLAPLILLKSILI
jgi:hypothetical protein